MKVCLVVNNVNTNNGGGRFVRDFIKSFQGSDVTFDVVAMNPVSDTIDFPLTILRPAWWRSLHNIMRLRSVVRRSDIVHSFDFFPNALFSSIALLGTRKKHVITAIGTSSISPLSVPVLSSCSVRVARAAYAVFAISQHTADLIHEKIPDLAVRIVKPFINLSWGQPVSPPQQEFTDRVRQHSPYVLSVLSKIKPRKGCLENIRVFAAAKKEVPELHYVMVATVDETDYAQSVEKEIDRLCLRDAVFLTGSVSDTELRWLYAHAEAHIMLSTYDRKNRDAEGFGLVYLEAARHGVWSVGTDDSGASDAIGEGKSGYLVHASHDNRMVVDAAKALVRIVTSKNKNEMSVSAKEFANSFSPEVSAGIYREIYASCVSAAYTYHD